MSALPPNQMRSMRQTAASESRPTGSLAQRWRDLHASAALLAKAADLTPEAFEGKLAAFPDALGGASEWQRDLAERGIDDIDAMMRPGLSALSTINARGNDASAPAMALWREFHHAREAILATIPSAGGTAPHA